MSNGPSSEAPMTIYSSYPKPEAQYQQIIQNPDFFLDKLRAFHDFYGTNFRVPIVGGSSLDLHQLFIEVTTRGGIEKVIKERRWKEIIAAFNFPTSITSASFVLRKYYLSLLYHFEQVCYFQKEEPTVIAAGQTLSYGDDDCAASEKLSANSNLGDGSLISGTIDGKFDDGYLVTMKVGSEVLKGVLYHSCPEQDAYQSRSTSDEPVHLCRRKNHTAVKDPAHPKRNRSGYTFFFAEQYQILRPAYHGQERAISKKIGHLWSNLAEAEKQVYQEKGLRDKERYKAEMLEYKSSQQMQG
ncbi:high mobility group B protein 10-like [Salvia splendens]|uniref:high mobility group B protein 10-like n=1 Tax=Salvia splendens TaxID=180675 RepID=UPI001C260BCD|nr:high mobility group B protein 10-like [Salvia splendens]